MGKSKKRVLKMAQVDDLKPHPLNAIFSTTSPDEDTVLEESMRFHGQQHPIDVLPDGTIVGGHRRYAAAKQLGWKEIRVRVRYDLAEAGEVAIEEFLLNDNFARRQMGMLETARVYRRLKQLRRIGNDGIRGDVRDLIAKQFDKSGRTLDRWTRLLDSPREVQDAVVAGKVKLTLGERVADLPEKVQAQIAKRIRSGESPKVVVESYVGNGKVAPTKLGTLLSRLIKDVRRHVGALDGRVEEIKRSVWAEDLPDLESGMRLLGQLIARIKANAARDESNSEVADVANLFRRRARERKKSCKASYGDRQRR